MGSLTLLSIIMMTLASVSTKPYCGKPPTPCSVTYPCNPGFQCMGDICRKCPCRKPSECELNGTKVICTNCNDGYSGDHCECPPAAVSECDDIYWMNKVCTKYAENGYVQLVETEFVYGGTPFFAPIKTVQPTGNVTECFKSCVEDECPFFQHDASNNCITFKFGRVHFPFRFFTKWLNEIPNTHVYVRRCDICEE
ncbi:uncharacterized protein LOC123556307 [Mercenaria mercenaria]|uniref:uncharacterized protein LOC123556307 n=1 Tax=Mercenaria mercenaria TaxID=6596 RepID=UPI00234EBA7E|nr:uncharacterized protein LOC123556307 [Mercenaria mercenaria]